MTGSLTRPAATGLLTSADLCDTERPMRALIAVCCVSLSGCAPSHRAPGPAAAITFLTRKDCVDSDTMRVGLNGALRVLGQPAEYVVVNADALPSSHPWRGYGTPTVLVGNRDLFGRPEPASSETPPP